MFCKLGMINSDSRSNSPILFSGVVAASYRNLIMIAWQRLLFRIAFSSDVNSADGNGRKCISLNCCNGVP